MKARLEVNTYIVVHVETQTIRAKIPKERVELLWEIMKTYPLNRIVKGTTIQKEWCSRLGFGKYFKKNGKFDSERFEGARGQKLRWYHTIKVLQSMGYIKHTKNGRTARIKDIEKVKHDQLELYWGKKDET